MIALAPEWHKAQTEKLGAKKQFVKWFHDQYFVTTDTDAVYPPESLKDRNFLSKHMAKLNEVWKGKQPFYERCAKADI